MTRLMSVSHTEAQVRNRSKTVTRRLGWKTLKQGDRLTLCKKVMGRRRRCVDCQHGGCPVCGGDGYIVEPLYRLADVEVTAAFREPLSVVTPSDVAAEGFPDWTVQQFIDFYCATFKVTPETIVTRIEWRYLEP